MIERLRDLVLDAIFFVVLSTSAISMALAQQAESCSSYMSSIESSSSTAVPIVPDDLLADWQKALPCLARIVGSLPITSPKFEPAVRRKYLSATGAIRAIMTRLTVADEAQKEKGAPSQLTEFAKQFRALDNFFDVVSVLTYGARNDSYDVRLNSVLILGNVIDENTVCIPLIQLFDASLDKEQNYVNGRANLLALVAVVAPYAYKEDFDNSHKTQNYFFNKIDRTDPNLKNTVIILNNIAQRLRLQTGDTNNGVPLPQKYKEKCKSYIALLPANDARKANLAY